MTSLTVSIIWRTGQLGPFSVGRLGNAFIPTFDHFSFTELKFEWLSPVAGRIEFLSIGQSTGVVDLDSLSFGGKSCTISFRDCFDVYTHDVLIGAALNISDYM